MSWSSQRSKHSRPYGDIREYAVKMFQNHGRGIGDKGKDNGLLVLLAVKDRRVWVEVGYDLEQFITDGFAGEVSRTAMTPYFARGEYGGGLLDGRHAASSARIAQGRGVTLTGVPQTTPGRGPDIRFGPWLILAVIVIVMLMNRRGGRGSGIRRGRNRGAPARGAAGIAASALSAAEAGSVAEASVAGSAGLAGDAAAGVAAGRGGDSESRVGSLESMV